MDSADTYWRDFALLDWQVDLGVDEAISETPINRYDLQAPAPKPVPNPQAAPKGKPPLPQVAAKVDTVAVAEKLAAGASDIAGLRAALDGFDHCELKRGARKMVFATGNPAADVMIVGEAASRDEDKIGAPFVGPVGELLDKMLAAITLARDSSDAATAAYLTTALPWPVPGDDLPTAADIAMLRPFVERHIALVAPKVLILMGSTPCQMLLGKGSVTRLRGTWATVGGIATMPMAHPHSLLKNPLAKRDAWADLLEIQAKLKDLT